MVEQGVAAGEQDAVDVDPADDPGQHRDVVRAQAHRADHAFVSQCGERRQRRGLRLVDVVVGVVDVDHVDPVQPEPREAVLDDRRTPPALKSNTALEPPVLGEHRLT